MTTVWRVVRAEALRRWASWLALAALVALVGGTVLAGASAARRTQAAFPDYLKRYGYDAVIYDTAPRLQVAVAHWSDVRKLVVAPFYVNDVATIYANSVCRGCGQVLPSNPTALIAMTPAFAGQVAKLVSGRLPTGVDDVDVGYATQQAFHLHVGSTIVVPLYAKWQSRQVFESSGTPTPHGTLMRFKVVGVVASAIDFPAVTPSYSIYASPRFATTIGRRSVSGVYAFARLRGGGAALPRFTYAINHLPIPPFGFVGAQPVDDQIAAVEGSINPQATAWWIFTLLAGLAGLALVGQALSRQSIVARDVHPTLSALGARPTQLFAVGMARAAAIGLAGTAGALAIATALSPFAPAGEARAAEPATGIVVDPLVFGLGGLASVAVVLVLGSWPSWRDAQVIRLRRREFHSVSAGASQVAAMAARSGAPTTAVIGIRHALERGRGRASVPVLTAVFGTIAAVGALVATSVFGASLTTLLATPRLYGQDFQAVLSSLSASQVHGIVAHLEPDPAVEGVSYAQAGKEVSINGVAVNATIAFAAKGPLVLSLASGREPTGIRQVALGSQTMGAVHASIGSTVEVSTVGPLGKTARQPFKVVGTVVFPPAISNGGGLGDGAIVTLPAALDLVCGSGPHSSYCREVVHHKLNAPQNFAWGVAVRVAPDRAGRAVLAELDRRFSSYTVALSIPRNLVNFGQAINFPLLLGITLAIFGVATLLHLLFASASRRRREFALLKVLGFVRGQIRLTVGWQATTVAVIGILVGVPIGIAVGNLVWQAFASNLGVVPLTVISTPTVAAIAAGVVLVSVVLALGPALLAARTRPAIALREE